MTTEKRKIPASSRPAEALRVTDDTADLSGAAYVTKAAPVQVVAALIWDGRKFMICQRPPHKARGLLYEFVGGKVEAGETKEQTLARECMEELGVVISVGDVFMTVTHTYPDMTVELTLFNATIEQGTPQLLEHVDIRWIRTEDIPEYEFCPADEDILKRLCQRP